MLYQEAPLTGTFLLGPGPQGAGPEVVLQTTVDDRASRLTERTPGMPASEPYFASHHITLSHGETVTIALFTSAVHGYSQWDLVVDYIADGKTAVMYVGRNGVIHGNLDPRPFAISALPPRIQDYGVVYTFPAQTVGDSYYRRINPDEYCSAVCTFYANTYRDRALDRWAC